MKPLKSTTLIAIFAFIMLAQVDPSKGQFQSFFGIRPFVEIARKLTHLSLNLTWGVEDTLPTEKELVSKSSGNFMRKNAVLSLSIANLFKLISPQLNLLQPLANAFERMGDSVQVFALCNACKISLDVIIGQVRRSDSPKAAIPMLLETCSILPINTDLCEGVMREYAEILIYIMRTKRDLTSDQMCAMYLQGYGCETKDPSVNWDILERMGYESYAKNDKAYYPVEIVHKNEEKSKGTLKILHLSDIHLDPFYEPGSEKKCGKEICCRGPKVTDYGQKDLAGAGYYGESQNCDLPQHTFENALAHIVDAHPDIDMIYMTGDLLPRIGFGWKISREQVQNMILNCSYTISKYFPQTPVIPVLGNHDVHPMNMYAPSGVAEKFSTDWFYKSIHQIWSEWLPADASETFKKGGFYSKIVNPYLRILVLNNNVCYSFNLWLAFDNVDPYGQLQWLVNELEEAVKWGQKVHILGHIPPNNDMCWQIWSENFYKIVNRYSSTIKAQFYGHVHYDDFGLYYHKNKKDLPINSFHIGPSLTPYSNLNPGYKIYTIDGAHDNADSTYQVLDHETWIFNLTDANLTPLNPPKWFKLYGANESYNLKNLSPPELNSFVQRMYHNETLFNQFNRNFYKDSDTQRSCTWTCRKSKLCTIVTPTVKQYRRCIRNSKQFFSPL